MAIRNQGQIQMYLWQQHFRAAFMVSPVHSLDFGSLLSTWPEQLTFVAQGDPNVHAPHSLAPFGIGIFCRVPYAAVLYPWALYYRTNRHQGAP